MTSKQELSKQISRIYRLASALGEIPYDEPTAPFYFERKTGVSREAVIHYVHQAIFYQNFWPRVVFRFDEGPPSIERIKIIKKSSPAAFTLCFFPWEAIMLKLVELGAYGGRTITKHSLGIDTRLNTWLNQLEESKKVVIDGDNVSLTHDGVSEAFKIKDKYCSLRADGLANIKKIVDILSYPTITVKYKKKRNPMDYRVDTFCDFNPNNPLCRRFSNSAYWNTNIIR